MNTFNTRAEWLVFVRSAMTGHTARSMSEHLGLCRTSYRYYELGDRLTPDEVVAAVIDAYPNAPPAPAKGEPKPRKQTEKVRQPKSRAVFATMVETYPDDTIPKSVILRWLGAL